MWYYPGTKREKSLPFQREEGRFPKTFKLAFAKKGQNKVIKCMVIICRGNYWKFKFKSKNAWRFPIISPVAL
ncbi:hypothetical protein ABY95_14540 [Listeria monocytogenes]|nr:hypothetical protein [Listeria monocytogenes]